MSSEFVPILFLVCGLLSPVYNKILRNNLSNEKGFLIAWGMAPFIVSYAYIEMFPLLILLIFLNAVTLILVFEGKYNYIWSGIVFLITSFVVEFFYKIL